VKILFTILLYTLSCKLYALEPNTSLKEVIIETDFIGVAHDRNAFSHGHRSGSRYKNHECRTENVFELYHIKISSVLKGNKNTYVYNMGFSDASIHFTFNSGMVILGAKSDLSYKEQEHLFRNNARIRGDCANFVKTKQIWRADLTSLHIYKATIFKHELSQIPDKLKKSIVDEEIILVPSHIILPEHFTNGKSDPFLKEVQRRSHLVNRSNMQAVYASEFFEFIDELIELDANSE
jgi:hypothetical protein